MSDHSERKHATLELTIGGLHFSAKLPAAQGTERPAVEARYLVPFERWVVKMICEYGSPSPDGFKFLRTRTRLKAAELGKLIGVTEFTISRWENDKNETGVPEAAWELMVTIAEEHLAGRSETLDRLRKRQEQRKKSPKHLAMDPRELTAP